jgi:hypothetical protein
VTDEEAERLDELSITDDEFAARLKAAEDDLIDAYVTGGLTADQRQRVETVYGATVEGRARIAFARSLAARTRRLPARRSWRPALAAAAVVVLAIGGYRLLAPGPVVTRDAAPPPVLTGPAPGAVPAPAAPPAKPPAQPPPGSLFVLTAPTRSATDVRAISVPEGNAMVDFWLEMEGDDFAAYDAALKDAAGVRTLWRSARLRAQGPASNRIVAIRVPANLLTPRRHIVELRGLPSGGEPQVVGSYPFRVVVQ